MNRSHLWKLLIIVFVVGWSLYELYPPTNRDLLMVFQELAEKKDAAFTNIIERAQALQKEKPDRTFGNLKEAVGTNNLTKYFGYIDLKAERDPNSAVLYWVQRQAAGKIKLGLDLQGGVSFLVEMDTSKLASSSTTNQVASTNQADQAVSDERKEAALIHAVEVLRKRVDKLGVAEPLLQPAGKDRILIQLPGLAEADKDQARRVIQKSAFLTIRMVHPDSEELVAQGIVEPGYTNMVEVRELENGTKRSTTHLVKKTPERGLTGKYIKRAGVGREQYTNKPEINFELDSEGAKIFEEITREYQPKGGKYFLLAIVLDDELYSAPRINEPIPGGRVRITGSFTEREAFELANVLENPLAAPVKIREERTVGPSLGRDSIRSGVTATLIGAASTFLFMLVFYFFGGLISNLALALNILILMGVMSMLGATLTMPGIAGIALTIGMAVDANVLIFERMREELHAGKTLRGVVSASYNKAFVTIFDSNLTTVIAAAILIWMGTGPVQGFGYTLTIGICASMFTALVVTRLIYDFLMHKGWIKTVRMLPIIKVPNLPFLSWAKVVFIASWLLVVVGVGYGFYRGTDTLGVDFRGGDSVKLGFQQKVTEQQLSDVISKLGVGEAYVQYQKNLTDARETLQIVTAFDAGAKVEKGLQEAFPQAKFAELGIDKVGPTVGKEITRSAIVASFLALFGILVYVAFRYEFSFTVAAVAALVHDVLLTLSIFCLAKRQFGAPMVAAILTIIGYSVNDKIVILDRIREDLRLGVRGTFKELINLALNQTLSRTIITGGAVILATLALLFFGGGVINDFAFTFLVGIITGTYSSIYIASALVLWWHKGQRPAIGTSPVVVENASPARG